MSNHGCNIHFELELFLPAESSLTPESPHITGKLVLSLAQPTRIGSIDVQLRGIMKRRWGSSARPQTLTESCTESVIFQRSWQLMRTTVFQTRIYGPGRHEIPLSLALGSGEHMRESVDGVEGYSVSYLLIGRLTRKFANYLTCHESIKVYRSHAPSEWYSFATAHTLDNEWPGKIRYSISIPAVQIPFGSDLCPRIQLFPSTEGLQIESITIEVVETHHFAPNPSFGGGFLKRVERSRVVCGKEFSSTKDPDISTQEIEGRYEVAPLVALPTSIHDCAHTVQSSHFDITHNVVVTIRIINIDGHISMVRAFIPIIIYMHNVDITQLKASSLYSRHIIPPVYGKHQEDPLVTESESMEDQSRDTELYLCYRQSTNTERAFTTSIHMKADWT
ncbi:hypothetical protein ASPACDRAFT_44242 [Aspergillus aculeatus ATCC 16872]|uniref:Arrestin C-terminal-like domain-containing protein n=1 Tax=Aspergillus aculeatus (strain ATCC 16872 / CBS 172.66 / WB 5094) TaxID=690307 RepID=A0A1L9WR05_ASPA1|nr:uncharacterized protein ASPACDRAFT_44242 [Aspergillus aculeatus ATCC 16872]OJJ98611.1 hypothetical protein ASPACDRAFT_44242 [Aspergillus aculeatus ATCC 16872]